MNTQFTTDDYLAAMKREYQKRLTTYPKIIIKMRKRRDEKEEIEKTMDAQRSQVFVLKTAMFLVRKPGEKALVSAEECLSELMRELKERKRCYPRWVKLYRMMTQETANYELAVWESLTRWFAKEYLDLDELPNKRKKKQYEI